MSADKYLHSWSFNRNNILIRWYVFALGEESLRGINFCKLFWATILAPLIAVFLFVMWTWESVIDKVRFGMVNREAKKVVAAPIDKKKVRRHRMRFFVSGIASGVDSVLAFISYHAKYFWGALTAAVLVGLGFLGLVCFNHIHTFLLVLMFLGIIFGAAVVVLGVLLGITILDEEYGIFAAIGDFLGRILGPVIVGFCRAIWYVLRMIGHFFATAYYAIKHRTCPLIEITDEVHA